MIQHTQRKMSYIENHMFVFTYIVEIRKIVCIIFGTEAICMKERKIVHADINHCYAQIIEMMYPELRDVPMAVGGNEAQRHGIILARNLKAKAYGVTTAESLREAYKKCPHLVIVPPKYELFMIYTEKVKDIYREYTDQVESFGLDEAWFDITNSQALFGDAVSIARRIQYRVKEEIGLTISMGVSFNKVFAKLGSDMIKPSGFVEICKDNFKDVVWPLPVEDLLYVGSKTKEKLNRKGIDTIGDLANTPLEVIQKLLGKNGAMIWNFSWGLDETDVALIGTTTVPKSIGNSITTPQDITSQLEARIVFQVLAESVASRLKDEGLQGCVLSVSFRDVNLSSYVRQQKLDQPTNISSEIMQAVMHLVQTNCDFRTPLRSVGIQMTHLAPYQGVSQLNLFDDYRQREKEEAIDACMDEIRERFGFDSVQRLSTHLNKKLTGFNPKGDHIIHPVSWL